MTHKSDTKQRTDNIWNMSIYIDDKCDIVNYKDFHLVIHLIYTIQKMYNLSNDILNEVEFSYELTNAKNLNITRDL